MSSRSMQRARVDGGELEFEVTGDGEPVLLIHGAFIAEAYAPLCAEPEVVHSLVLLEPALLDVPSGAMLAEALGPVLERYAAGDKEGAADGFLRWAIGPDYRVWLDRLIPGALQQLVADADTFFGVEYPSMQEWRFTREDARRITQPVLAVLGGESASIWPGWTEVQDRLRDWLPQAEPFVLAGANHALEERDPRGISEAMAPFFARHFL